MAGVAGLCAAAVESGPTILTEKGNGPGFGMYIDYVLGIIRTAVSYTCVCALTRSLSSCTRLGVSFC